jgi:hypothetical protein
VFLQLKKAIKGREKKSKGGGTKIIKKVSHR